MLVAWLAAIAAAAWLAVLLLPSRPWQTRERLAPRPDAMANPGAVTALVPARDEADTVGATLAGLAAQGPGLAVVLVDDQSQDGTAGAARAANAALAVPLALTVVAGRPLPDGWGGKLWALEQGLEHVQTPYCLLLDAEIALAPGVIAALLDRTAGGERALVSVMAKLRCESFWERLLVPPFIFFFKLLYPFARVNAKGSRTAAAAGGCILIETRVLREIGGFAPFRDALIDDCALAGRVKRAGHGIWLGLSDAVTSARAYPDLASFRRMVARTAFTQLRYSASLLVLVGALMLVVFVLPWLAIASGPGLQARLSGALAILLMAAAYWPTVAFYRLPLLWTLTLPVAGVLFLMMTLESAVRYWRGVRAEWKGRTYAAR